MTVNLEIRKAFNQQAIHYEQQAIIQREIGERLFERLAYLTLKPRCILDIGCGPGFFSQRLKKYYPDAQVVGIDLAEQMLHHAKSKQTDTQWAVVQGDMTQLPFAAETFDLIFANQVIHWGDFSTVLQALHHVMTREGCLMFTTLGPDTFIELRDAFAIADDYAHVNTFADMHDLADALLQEGFLDPVVDMEHIVAHYTALPALLRSLKRQGVKNIHPDRRTGLMGKKTWTQFTTHMQSYLTPDEKYPLTYEVIYGHAWKTHVPTRRQGSKTFLSLSQMKALLTE